MKRAIMIAAALTLLTVPAGAWVSDLCGLRDELAKTLVHMHEGLAGSDLPEDERKRFDEETTASLIAAYDAERDLARDYLERNGVCPPKGEKGEPWRPLVHR